MTCLLVFKGSHTEQQVINNPKEPFTKKPFFHKPMKKFFSSIAMMLLAMVVCVPVKAQLHLYWSIGSDCVTEPQAGAYYVVEGAGQNPNSTQDYLFGSTTTNNPTYDAIYQFEPAGEDESGSPLWRLLWVKEGKYLADPDKSGGAVSYTEAKSSAYVFTALPAIPSELGYKDAVAAGVDIRTYHYNGQDNAWREGCMVFCNKNYQTSSYRWFEWYPGSYGVMWDQYTTANIWNIFLAEPYSAYDQLCMFLGENANADGKFIPGNQPGQVPQELIDALVQAIADATELQNNPDAEDSVYEAAVQKVLDAIEACQKGMVQVSTGYYIFTNNPDAGRGNGHAVIYDRGTEMHWQEFDPSAGIKVENLQCIWEVMPAEDVENGFYLKNLKTNRYAGGQNSTNSVLPTTEAPEQVYFINPFPGTDLFVLEQKDQNAKYPALHAQGDGSKIVIWESVSGASAWALTSVDESIVKGLQEELKQVVLNEKYSSLLSEAKALYAKGFVYSADGVSADGVFTVGDGLLTSADKMVSNAKEPSEGAYADLLDGSFDTYFHTVWSSGDYASLVHSLDIELDEAIDILVIKYAKRPTDGGGNPYKVHVYASNDTVGGNWTDQGYMYCSYPWSIMMSDGTEKANQAGSAHAAMDGKYKYVRLAVEETTGMSYTNGNLYWYLSELRAYPGYYDKTKSLIEAVPADVRKNYEDAIAKAEKLVEGNVTQADIDELQAAYDTFKANFPDPEIVKSMLAEAIAQAEAAVEGEGYGYFAEGSKAALEAVIESVSAKVKDVMTTAEVNAAKSELEAGLKAFNNGLMKPADGAYVFIRSASASTETNSPADKYLYAKDNSESSKGIFRWGELNLDNISAELNFMWKVIETEGGYMLQNAATGTYIDATEEAQYYTGMSYDEEVVQIQSAKVGGAFNIVLNDNVFLMAYTDGGSMVSWGEANGADNCAFAFEDVEEWDAIHTLKFEGSYARIISLPFALNGYLDSEVVLYSVLGSKDNALQLKQYGTEETIPAGTAFIMIPETGVQSAQLFCEAQELSELTYNFESVDNNGLVSTVRATKVGADLVLLFEGDLLNTVEGETVSANSGYLKAILPTEETGDVSIAMPEDLNIPNGINQIVTVKNPSNTGVYTITGVKVRNNMNIQGLPKGIYIVGGQKVLVK